MGASNDGRIYREASQSKVAQMFRASCDSDAWENGGSYSGTIAMTGGRIDRFLDMAYTDGTIRKDAELRQAIQREEEMYGGGGRKPNLNQQWTGRDKAERLADSLAEKWEGAVAVSFMYSPGPRMKRRKGWAVMALCSS